jgi:short-subunit dehydrogenase
LRQLKKNQPGFNESIQGTIRASCAGGWSIRRIGCRLANALATEGLDLVLIARRKEPLLALSRELETRYKINIQIICCDLAAAEAVSFIQESLEGKKPSFLVYNAASSYIGPFTTTPVSKHREVESVNISSLLRLIHGLSGSMLQDRHGGIVIMSSLAGFQGSGFLATYAASKAFARILAESLWYEWRNKGVDIIACCAGATATPNFMASAPQKISFLAPKPQSPARVVEECLEKIGKTPSFVSGGGNKVATFFMQHIFPRRLAIRIMGDTTSKMYGIKY